MNKKYVIAFILILSIIIAIFAQQSCGEFPCKLVTPTPPYCRQVPGVYMCASTACSMVMKYWAINGVVNEKDCQGYQAEFKTKFGSIDGGAPSNKIAPALKSIGEANRTLSYKNADVIISSLNAIRQYSYIVKHLKYSSQNDDISPWDRPGVLVYRTGRKEDKTGHAVCAWGYYKGPLNIINLPEDPNAPPLQEPTGTNIPKKMRWGIIFRIHDGQSSTKYYIIPQNNRGEYARDGDMIFVWFNKKECSLK